MFASPTPRNRPRAFLLPACAILFAAPSASGAVLYVDASATAASDGTSWADAFNNLQDAVATADARNADADPDNDITEIWVAEGTYMPDGGYKPVGGAHVPGHGDRTATFQLLTDVALYGGFAGNETSLDQRDITANETILSGDLAGDDEPVVCTKNEPDCFRFGDFCDDGFCIIRANTTDNSLHVVTGSMTDATAVLDGFTITAGNANVTGTDAGGGGMYIESGNPTLVNCTFTGNRAQKLGGGLQNIQSSPTLINCTFRGNEADIGATAAGGGMHNHYSSPTVMNCIFAMNRADFGGGMANIGDESAPTITDCTFINNAGTGNVVDGGGGIGNSDGSRPVIRRCWFEGNRASNFGGGMSNKHGSAPLVVGSTFIRNVSELTGGGMANNTESRPVLINCDFVENTALVAGGLHFSQATNVAVVMNCVFQGNVAALEGGAMLMSFSRPTVTHCTLSANSARTGGGMFNVNNSSPVVANSILWGNSDASGSGESAQVHTVSGAPIVNHSIIQGGWSGAGGVGVIDADPMFVDPLGPDGTAGTEDDDLRLMPGSPAIDAGDNDAVPEGVTTDLDGHPRFVDDPATPDTGNPGAIGPPVVDIGAYEFQGLCPDADDDEVCDADDACPESTRDHTIVIDGCDSLVDNILFSDGCTMSDLIHACAEGAANHGRFVRCVTRLTNDLTAEGFLRPQDKGAIQRCAARVSIPG